MAPFDMPQAWLRQSMIVLDAELPGSARNPPSAILDRLRYPETIAATAATATNSYFRAENID